MTNSREDSPLIARLSPQAGSGRQRGKLAFEMRENRRRSGVLRRVLSKTKPVNGTGSGKGATSSGRREHSDLYNLLNPKSRHWTALIFQRFIMTIIIFDSLCYVLSTEPALQDFHYMFYFEEGVTSSIFLAEYIARLAVCTEKRSYARHGPIRGRWRFMISGPSLLDALATFPFFIELLLHRRILPTMTYLRVFRLLRITRTSSYSKAMDAVGRVFFFNREILQVAGLLGIYLVIITSILMYYLRPRGNDVDGLDDPSDFESIASTMVLSILMLTGQGGPSGQLPWYDAHWLLLSGNVRNTCLDAHMGVRR